MYYFIVNPNSCGGKGAGIWKKLERQLCRESVEYSVYFTEKQGDAAETARKLTEGCKDARIIVAVGGDGTVNEILNGLCFCSQITLGYIPAGSGNDLARSLKLPGKPLRCLKKVLHPQYYKLLDYGVVSYENEAPEHRRFMISSGIGLDAAVCHDLLYAKENKKSDRLHSGRIGYLLSGIRQLFLSHSVKGYLLLDGVQKVEFNHIYFISAHIHPYEGGGFKFAPKADCCDGKLTLCVVHNKCRRKVIPFLLKALRGRQSKTKGVRNYTCQEVMIHVDRPLPVHADGESCFCQDNLQIQCIEKKIRMIV